MTTRSSCMQQCDDIDTPTGYTRMPLEIPPGGPGCRFKNRSELGKVNLICALAPLGFGFTPPANGYNVTGPLSFYNTRNGQTLEIAGIRMWAWRPDQRRLFFHSTVDYDGQGGTGPAALAAVAMANSALANDSNETVPVELRYAPTHFAAVLP